MTYERKLRAVGYVRVSTDDQVENRSLDAQRLEILRHCERQGYEFVHFYADEGVSAHTDEIGKRPRLAALLDDARCGLFNVVVVHTIDRWARNVGVQRRTLQQLGNAQVGFASVTENFDFTTPAGQLMLTMIGGVSEFFSDQLGVHVAKGQRARAEAGLPIGPVPFGYEAEVPGGVPVKVPQEAQAIGEVFERRVAGDSTGEIASWLNARGDRTRTGRMFTPYTVRDMLRCRFYTGVVRYRGEEFRGRHEPVVSDDVFERVQTLSLQRRRRPRRVRGGESGVLRGLLGCGYCGSAIHSERNHYGYPMYRERHGRPCKTNGRSVVAHHLDEQIAEVFRALELPRDWRDRMVELVTQRRNVVDTSTLFEQRQRLARAYADGAFNDTEYETRLAAIDSQIRAAQPISSPSIEEAARLFSDLPALWTEAAPDERRRLIAPLIERVYVGIDTRRVGAITPSPTFRALLERGVERATSADCVVLTPAEAQDPDRNWCGWWRRGSLKLPVQRIVWVDNQDRESNK